MLNKALRTQNIELLLLFRFVIADIYTQLKRNQCQSSVKVYRGQIMSNEELNTLQHSIGEYISINSFFSTSFKRQEARYFLDDVVISNELYPVLFEIDADSNLATSRPFADITDFSDYQDEGEVLFMAGCVFQINKIYQDEKENIWIIQMKLCGDNDYKDLKILFDHLKKEYGGGDGQVNLHLLGDVLHHMGKYDLAEEIYRRVLDDRQTPVSSLPHLYRSLGMLLKTKGDYNSSLELFHEALNLQTRTDEQNHENTADLYKQIGTVYSDKNVPEKAWNIMKRPLNYLKKLLMKIRSRSLICITMLV